MDADHLFEYHDLLARVARHELACAELRAFLAECRALRPPERTPAEPGGRHAAASPRPVCPGVALLVQGVRIVVARDHDRGGRAGCRALLRAAGGVLLGRHRRTAAAGG